MTKRRWGYIVWGVALAFVFIPEILGAWQVTERHLPFTTISSMIGHLEFENPLWELAPTTLVVLALYSLWRVPPATSGENTAASVADATTPHRTAGGRLAFRVSPDTEKPTDTFDSEAAGWGFVGLMVTLGGVIAGLTVWAAYHWPTAKGKGTVTNFHVGYVLYGSIAALCIAAPSLYSVLASKDAAFPTLFRTVKNLEDWLTDHRGNMFGKLFAWLVPYVLLWGLVFMMIHLTLYPFPDITHILNPSGR